jgi:hypothetical protein
LWQAGEFVFIPIPMGYGVLEYDFRIVASDGISLLLGGGRDFVYLPFGALRD